MVEQYLETSRSVDEQMRQAREQLELHTSELAQQLAPMKGIEPFSFTQDVGDNWIHPNFFRFFKGTRQQGSYPRQTLLRYDFKEGIVTRTILQNRHTIGPIVEVPNTTEEFPVADIDFTRFSEDELLDAAEAMEKAREKARPTSTQA